METAVQAEETQASMSESLDSEAQQAASPDVDSALETTAEGQGDSVLAEIDSVADLEALTDEYLDDTDREDFVDTKSEETPESEEKSPEPEQPEKVAEEAEEPEKEDEEPEQEAEEAPLGQPKNFRLKATNELDAETFAIRKRNPDLSLEECIAKAKSKLGIAEEAKPAPKEPEETKPEEADDSPQAMTLADAEAKILELRSEIKQATIDLEFEKLAELQDEIYGLQGQIPTLMRAEEQERKQLDNEFQSIVNTSKTKALEMYPDCGNSNSAITAKMEEIDVALRDTNNPLYLDPDKPLKIAQMAANSLGIAPFSKSDPPVAPPKPKPAPKPPIMPASGSASTAPNPDSGIDKMAKVIDSISDVDELESFTDRFLDRD